MIESVLHHNIQNLGMRPIRLMDLDKLVVLELVGLAAFGPGGKGIATPKVSVLGLWNRIFPFDQAFCEVHR